MTQMRQIQVKCLRVGVEGPPICRNLDGAMIVCQRPCACLVGGKEGVVRVRCAMLEVNASAATSPAGTDALHSCDEQGKWHSPHL